MADTDPSESPLEAAAGAAGPHTTEAFELLGNETRLAILLSLWEAHTPFADDNAVSFSELRDRVGVRDSGQFNYHLGKLDGHFVAETEDGYELKDAGLNIVQAVIAGSGFGEETLPPTEIQMSCSLCDAPTEISYEDGLLYQTCTACEGYYGEEFGEDLSGLIAARPFNAAGVANRSPEEIFATSHINSVVSLTSFVRGVCPTCSGAIDTSVQVCESHQDERGKVCPNCGSRHEARVKWVCSVCKEAGIYTMGVMTHNQPAVDAFYYEQGLGRLEHVDDPETCVHTITRDRRKEYEIESVDPLRVHITVPGTDADLHMTLDEELTVVDITKENREAS